MEREHKLCQEIFGRVPDGLLVTDIKGVIREADAATLSLLGIDVEELGGASIYTFISPADRDDFCSRLAGLEGAEQLIDCCAMIEPARGEALAIDLSVKAMPDSGSLQWTLRDASENRRDHLLTGIAIASQSLLAVESLDKAMKEALRALGTAMDVDKIFIFESYDFSSSRIFIKRFDWLKENMPLHKKGFSRLDLSPGAAFSRWHEVLSNNRIIHGRIDEFPEAERRVLEEEGIKSIIVAPIITNGNLWGFMGFDDCTSNRVWSQREKAGVLIAAGSIGSAIFRKRAEGERCLILDDLETKVSERTKDLTRANNALRREISERRKAENALKQSEERYRHLVETMNEGFGIRNENDILTYVNDKLCSMLGCSKEEIVGRCLTDFMDKENRHMLEHQMDRRRSGDSASYELKFKRSDGRELPTIISPRPIFDEEGRFKGSFAVVTDITERMQSEEALRKASDELEAKVQERTSELVRINRELSSREERFKTSIDTLPDSFGICSAVRDESGTIVDFRIEYVNNEACRHASCAREDLIGRSLFCLMPSLRHMGVFQDCCNVVEKDYPLEREGLLFEKANSSKRLKNAFEIRAVKLGDGIAISWKEVTGRKQAERERDDLRRQMEFILGATRTGLSIVDSDFNLRYVDPEWKKAYGELELSGKKCYLYFNCSEETCPGCPAARAIRTRRVEVSERCMMMEGKRPVQVTTIPYQDDQGNWLAAQVHVDITERKAAEEELRKRECLLMGVSVATNALLTAGDFDAAINESLELLGCTADVDRVYIYENHDFKEKHFMSMKYEWARDGARHLIKDPMFQNAPYDQFPKWYSRLSSNKPINGLVKDFPSNIKSRIEPTGAVSLLMIPIMIDDRFWGVIGFDECQIERLWTWSEVSILLAAAGSLGGAVARRLAEVKLRASLDEKDVLLKEVHHRVKNNLQVISSLLSLQSNSVEHKGASEALRESQNRVKSMALIHEKLYRSGDLAKIDFAEYARNLAHFLHRSYEIENRKIKLNMDLSKVYLGINTAIPCGLILNELVSNCFKHAFKGKEAGEIKISLQSRDKALYLIVRDNGVGLPGEIEITNTKSLGMRLVANLVKQLKGTIDVIVDGGTEFKITLAE